MALLTAGELVERAWPPHADDLGRDLREAVEALCVELDSRSLAGRFQHFARRNFGGRMLDKGGADSTRPVPAAVTLLCAEGDPRWDRVRPSTRDACRAYFSAK